MSRNRVPFFDDPLNRLWALDLFSRGLNQLQAAREMGISSRTIIRWLDHDEEAHREFERTRPVPEVIHGTASAYRRHGCRCDLCKAAQTETHRDWKDRVAGKPPTHGLNGYTNYRCRCEVCKEAGSVANKAYRQLRLSASR